MSNEGSNQTKDAARRHFLKSAALGALITPLAACARDDAGSPASSGGTMQGVPQGSRESASAGDGLTTETVRSAGRVLGLDFTDTEYDQMLPTLESRLEQLAALRAIEIPNDLPPALTFDPRLPDSPLPPGDTDLTLSPATAALPEDDAAIAYASVRQLGAWLRDGSLTSRRLTDIYLARIEQYGAQLECFVTVTPALAREQADAADRALAAGTDHGPLHGIPYVMKDIIDTDGVLTTWGAAPYKDRVAEADATVTRLLKQAGAVHLAKSTAGAIAYGDIWFGGVTRNPWNPKEGSSGSSAGSASATAAGLCAFSIGTETLGSIVSPSERCGTTGLRPTFGRVSRTGAMALCWSLDKIGPICRYAEDTAAVLSVINGFDNSDPSSIRTTFGFDADATLEGMRVGHVPAWFEDADETDVAALDAARSLGIDLVEIEWPDLPYGLLVDQLLAEAAAAFSDLTLSNRDDELTWQEDNAWPNGWRAVRFLSSVDYIQLDRLRRRTMQAMQETFSGIDALIGPSFAGGALTATNFTGQPQMAIRAGYAERPTRTIFGEAADESGETFRVPRSFSIWGPLFGEAKVIRLATALEEALGVAAEMPPQFR